VATIVYIDMDDVLCDYTGAHRSAIDRNPGIKFPQSQYDFFRTLIAIDGAIEALLDLNKSEIYEPYILTAPSCKNPLCYTEKRLWIEDNLGFPFVNRLIICAHKNLLKGDILIDDNLVGRGQERFEGRLIHFGSKAFPDWKSVRKEMNV
jgi:5'-nucleotidase